MAVRFSKCCNPVPGDEIVGFVTRGRGMSIHRTDCINIINLSDVERSRLITAEWEENDQDEGGQYLAELKIFADDRRGLLLDVSKVFTEEKIDVKSMNTRTSKKGTATMEMGFVVHGREELNRVIGKLRQIENVIDIERTTADQGKVDGGKRMKVESIVLGSIGTNCYIVTNEETKECFAVDMAECPQEYVNYIKNNGLEMKALFLTHGHFDHIMGIDDFLKAFPVRFTQAKTNFL